MNKETVLKSNEKMKTELICKLSKYKKVSIYKLRDRTVTQLTNMVEIAELYHRG